MWKQLSDTWQAINDMRGLSWTSVNCKNIRTSLESALEELSGIYLLFWSVFNFAGVPLDIQRCAPFSNCRNKILSYLDNNLVVADLRATNLKERHWLDLKRSLRAQWQVNKVILGDIWDAEPVKNKAVCISD
jgi:hypothetical protein